MSELTVNLTVNGRKHTVSTATHRTLLYLLRDELHLYGTKDGCSEGECGACTVLMNGQAVNACLILAGQAEGTPGLILSSVALLDQCPQPDEDQIRHALTGNLCRCTGYAQIVEAVRQAAVEMAAGTDLMEAGHD